MGAFDFLGGTDPQTGQFKMDPNIIAALAQMGTAVGEGKSAGEVLGAAASTMVRNKAMQQQGSGMIKELQNLKVTPKGQPGPDAITTKQTADGTTTTIQTPSAANLNTFGTSVPPEAQPKGGLMQSPFWRALLGNQ